MRDDEEPGLFSKKVNKMRPGDSKDDARHLFHEVRNIVLEEKGLPKKESYYISRS